MALQSSGSISLDDVSAEFGGTAPHGLKEYYGSGGAPASGTMSLKDFYGLSNGFAPTITAKRTTTSNGNKLPNTVSIGMWTNNGSASPSTFVHNGSTITLTQFSQASYVASLGIEMSGFSSNPTTSGVWSKVEWPHPSNANQTLSLVPSDFAYTWATSGGKAKWVLMNTTTWFFDYTAQTGDTLDVTFTF